MHLCAERVIMECSCLRWSFGRRLKISSASALFLLITMYHSNLVLVSPEYCVTYMIIVQGWNSNYLCHWGDWTVPDVEQAWGDCHHFPIWPCHSQLTHSVLWLRNGKISSLINISTFPFSTTHHKTTPGEITCRPSSLVVGMSALVSHNC